MRHALTPSLLLALAVVLGVLGGPGSRGSPDDGGGAGGAGVTYILVRHAEKADDGTPDPALTEAGRARAERLASMLRSMRVVGVYTTAYERTRATAAPIGAMAGVRVEAYDPRDAGAAIERIRAAHARGSVVIVGHSNTVPDLVRRLGGACGQEMLAEDAYDDVFVVTVLDDGRVVTHRLHS